MLKTLNGTKLIRFEPDAHASWLYHWYYSGLYPEFFRDWAVCPSIADLATAAAGKTFMVMNEEGKTIGGIMFFNLSEHSRRAEIALLIDKAFEAKGYGFRAFKILSYYLLNTCNLFKVKVSIMARNKRLNQIMKKLGATQEGQLRKEAYLDGEFHDITVWGMTKGEFNKKYKDEIEGLIREKIEDEIAQGDQNGRSIWVKPEAIENISRPAVRASGAAA